LNFTYSLTCSVINLSINFSQALGLVTSPRKSHSNPTKLVTKL
jgi:hypothetical protein